MSYSSSLVDSGIWKLVGLGGVSFVWSSWDARFVPCKTDVEVVESVDIEECREVELCSEASYTQIGTVNFKSTPSISLMLFIY